MIISIPFAQQKLILEKSSIAIAIVWLFQIPAIIGISLGYEDWFLSKTPLTLLIHLLLVVWVFPFQQASFRIATSIIVLTGFFAEWLGINHLPIFGAYEYGANFGMKAQGTPLLIGFNWFVLAVISNSIAKEILGNKLSHLILGALLMVFLDFFMELVASPFDYWTFKDGIPPIQNYLSWFGIGLIMNIFLRKFHFRSQFKFSLNLFLANLLFFCYFALFY